MTGCNILPLVFSKHQTGPAALNTTVTGYFVSCANILIIYPACFILRPGIKIFACIFVMPGDISEIVNLEEDLIGSQFL